MKQLLTKALKSPEKAAAFLAIADLVSVPQVQRQTTKELRPAELKKHLEKVGLSVRALTESLYFI